VENASVQELRVVHSSYGRLRVHVPDGGGRVTDHLRGCPGVTSATANDLTGNLLILFDPPRTSAQALLAELRALCGNAPAGPPLPPPPAVLDAVVPLDLTPLHDASAIDLVHDLETGLPVPYVTGVRRSIYKALGWSSVGMAVVGAITPGIPTVPFVVLASYFFVRSSPEARDWLLHSPWFGPLLRDWEEHRAVKRSVKYSAVGLMVAALAILLLLELPPAVIGTVLVLELIGLVLVMRLPVIEPTPLLPAPAPV
jgi:uncharacterized membrane protein YbaN (DUF454 family)